MNAPRVPRSRLSFGARAFVALIATALVSVALLVIVGGLAGVAVLLHWIFFVDSDLGESSCLLEKNSLSV